MIILSHRCKPSNFESLNVVKLSFINIQDLDSDFIQCESWLIIKTQPGQVFSVSITLIVVHLRWVNWFHFPLRALGYHLPPIPLKNNTPSFIAKPVVNYPSPFFRNPPPPNIQVFCDPPPPPPPLGSSVNLCNIRCFHPLPHPIF